MLKLQDNTFPGADRHFSPRHRDRRTTHIRNQVISIFHPDRRLEETQKHGGTNTLRRREGRGSPSPSINTRLIFLRVGGCRHHNSSLRLVMVLRRPQRECCGQYATPLLVGKALRSAVGVPSLQAVGDNA
ncbi:hypothetical protein O3P69_005683 [Scylla paramamosain]|uniref:Uncharacterized protein n=1 Tax=Scylla paramamosain TaxID=85552 RepID=A0AAW0U6P8_SCYPA